MKKDPNPESWNCIDCGFNTAPGFPTRSQLNTAFDLEGKKKITATATRWSEIYMVKNAVWKAAGMGGYDGCLCIGCLEKRIGGTLTPKDFPEHPFNTMPGTPRLLDRRGMPKWYRYAWKHPLQADD